MRYERTFTGHHAPRTRIFSLRLPRCFHASFEKLYRKPSTKGWTQDLTYPRRQTVLSTIMLTAASSPSSLAGQEAASALS